MKNISDRAVASGAAQVDRHAVQPFLDDSLVLGADPSVMVPTLNFNIDWNWFNDLEKIFLAARKVHNARKNKRQKAGRPSSAPGPGREGFGFFGMLRAFLFAPFFEIPGTASAIHRALHANPAYLAECAFPPQSRGRNGIVSNPCPSFWALNEFENIMTQSGFWEDVRRICIEKGMEFGAIPENGVGALDPTPIKAYARSDKKKRCSCDDKQSCNHYRTEADRDAKYYRIAKTRIVRAYRPMIVGEVTSGIPLMAYMPDKTTVYSAEDFKKALEAVESDGAVAKLKIREWVADAEFDADENRANTLKILKAPLYAGLNPRARKNKKMKNRGIKHLSPSGIPVCNAGRSFEYAGRDTRRDAFIFRAPHDEKGNLVCVDCPINCTSAEAGRMVRVPRELAPHIDWEMPQHSIAFKMRMAARTEIERIISRIKTLGAGTITKQGKKKVAARVTRSIIAAQLVAIVAAKLNRPDAIRCIRSFRT